MRYALVALVAVLVVPIPWRSNSPTVQAREPERDHERELLEALQGTWVITSHLEAGKPVELRPKREWIISGREVRYLEDGEERGRGKLTLHIDRRPKRLHFINGGDPKDAEFVIFAVDGGVLTTCGNRQRGGDPPPYPEKFASGTDRGGDYLIIWDRR